MREQTLKTREASCVPRAAKHFFIPVVHNPLGAMAHVIAPELPLGQAKPGAMGHVAAPEPTSSGRRGTELRDTWQCRSSPQQGDEVRGCGARGSAGAHLSREARSGATGHVAAPEPTSAGRRGPELQGTWQRVDARLTPCLDLKLVCGGTRSIGYR
jgi:hypothetical protein